MTEVDFTDDLWLFLSPWGKHLENHRYFDAIALAWVALWNHTIDPTLVKTGQIRRVCRGLFDMPTDELIDILTKRRAAFFPDDNRLIETYRVTYSIDDFSIFVTFADRSINMSSKDQERWERLAALGVKSEIPTPEGEASMSAVIVQLAEPLLKQHGKTQQRAEAIIMLTIAGWNKSMFPPDKQPLVEKDLIDAFVPREGSAEDVGVAVQIMDMVVERRERLFPDLRKIVVDYKCSISGGRLTLEVRSAPIPDLG